MERNDWLLLAASAGISGYLGYLLGLLRGRAAAPAPSSASATSASVTASKAEPGLGDMVSVPSGSFHFSPSDRRTTRAYAIDRLPVTNRAYLAFAEATGSEVPRQLKSFDSGALDEPVVWVSRVEAEAYCRWAGKRLPTAEEWVRAARGDDDARALPWGDTIPAEGRAVFAEPKRKRPCPVAARGRTPHGCYDMLGNVWEWTSPGALRGGFWGSPTVSVELVLELPSDQKTGSTGFRCAKDL